MLVKEVKAFLVLDRQALILLRALTACFGTVRGVKDDAKSAPSCHLRALLVGFFRCGRVSFGRCCEQVGTRTLIGLLFSLAVFGHVSANLHLVKRGERFALRRPRNILLLLLILDSYDTFKLFSLHYLPILGIP